MIDLFDGFDFQVVGEDYILREGEGFRDFIICGIEMCWCWKREVEGCICYSDSCSSDEDWFLGEDGSYV